MADIDFSNAVLEPVAGIANMNYPYLNLYDRSLYDANQNAISYATCTIVSNTHQKITFQYTGSCYRGGTEMYFFRYNTKAWRISNISFAAGDTFSFEIDIETIGNT